jgi:hypothetical protein
VTLDELLDALFEAAKDNHQAEFDRLERDLLNRFEGGFAGMPGEFYQRYLEVDKAWPVQTDSVAVPESRSNALGPRLLINTRVPEELLEWLIALGAETGRTRSDVLSECLNAIRFEPELEAKVRTTLASRTGDKGQGEPGSE